MTFSEFYYKNVPDKKTKQEKTTLTITWFNDKLLMIISGEDYSIYFFCSHIGNKSGVQGASR